MDTSRDPEVVVTGAAGFIGGRLAERYAATGRRVVAIDLPGREFGPARAAGADCREADVTDTAGLRRALDGVRPGLVVHCAALMGGWGDPSSYQRVNVEGTRHVAGWAGASGAARFVYVSSVTVYGMPPRTAIDEEAPLIRIGLPYADSKIQAEGAVRRAHAGGLPCTILRPGDVYGPRAGEWVVKLVEAMRARRMPLIAGGSGYINTTYVDNLADAVEAAASRPAAAGRVYNVTDGAPTTWRTYLDALASAAHLSSPRLSIPSSVAWPAVLGLEAAGALLRRRPPLTRMGLRLLTARCSYSIDRARKELSWEPRIDLQAGMTRVGAWLRDVDLAGRSRP